MTSGREHCDAEDIIDPEWTSLLAPLVDLAGQLSSIENALQVVLTFYGAGSVAADVASRVRPRRATMTTAFNRIQDGIGATQMALESLAGMEDVRQGGIQPRRNGFWIRKNVFHQYKEGLKTVQKGLKDITAGAEVLVDLTQGGPNHTEQYFEMSEDASRLIDLLGECLRTLAGVQASRAHDHATPANALNTTKRFLDHVQSTLSNQKTFFFESDR